jgi:hypothetical protein
MAQSTSSNIIRYISSSQLTTCCTKAAQANEVLNYKFRNYTNTRKIIPTGSYDLNSPAAVSFEHQLLFFKFYGRFYIG